MNRLLSVVGISVLFSILLFSTPVTAQQNVTTEETGSVSGQPEIKLYIPDNSINQKKDKSVKVKIQNRRNIRNSGPSQFNSFVTTARSAVLDVDAIDSDVSIENEEIPVGNIRPGNPTTVSVDLDAPRGQEGRYNLDLTLEYEYISTLRYRGSEIVSTVTREDSIFDTKDIQLTENPQFVVKDVESSVKIGQSGITEVQIQNSGDDDLKNARISLKSGSQELQISSGRSTNIYVGDWENGEIKTIEIPTTFSQNALLNKYFIQSSVKYIEGGETVSTSFDTLSVQPTDSSGLTVESISTDSSIGGTGSTIMQLRNTGNNDIKSGSLELQSDSSAIEFAGGASSTKLYIGTVEEGETKRVSFGTSISETAVTTKYKIDTTLIHKPNGQLTSNSRINGVYVVPSERVRINAEIINDSVREGEEGQVVLEVMNNGTRTVKDVTLSMSSTSSINVLDTKLNLEKIDGRESKTIEIPVESSRNVDSSRADIESKVSYRVTGQSSRDVDENRIRVKIDKTGSNFGVSASNTSINSGETKTITVSVTNRQSNPVTNINAKFTGNGPVSVSNDESYIESLGSEQTERINMTVSSGSTLENTHPIELDFVYDTEDGDARISKVYSIPISVENTEQSSGSNNIIPILILVSIFAFAGIAYRKRDKIEEYFNNEQDN